MEENNGKTHYRKAFNSPYLSSADIVDAVQLTITRVGLEPDRTKKTNDRFNTAHFLEKEIRPGEALKPMILNATNSRVMADLTGSKFIDDWNNVPVKIYVDSNVRFGRDTVEGLRISPVPVKPREALTPDHKLWRNAIERFRKDGHLEAVLKTMDISDEHKALLKKQASEQE